MFRALTCPSSREKIIFTVRSQPVYCADVYRERKYQMLCEYNFSSWRCACQCSKHVEGNCVTNILLINRENCALKLVDEIILYYDARSKKYQIIIIIRIFYEKRPRSTAAFPALTSCNNCICMTYLLLTLVAYPEILF